MLIRNTLVSEAPCAPWCGVGRSPSVPGHGRGRDSFVLSCFEVSEAFWPQRVLATGFAVAFRWDRLCEASSLVSPWAGLTTSVFHAFPFRGVPLLHGEVSAGSWKAGGLVQVGMETLRGFR